MYVLSQKQQQQKNCQRQQKQTNLTIWLNINNSPVYLTSISFCLSLHAWQSRACLDLWNLCKMRYDEVIIRAWGTQRFFIAELATNGAWCNKDNFLMCYIFLWLIHLIIYIQCICTYISVFVCVCVDKETQEHDLPFNRWTNLNWTFVELIQKEHGEQFTGGQFKVWEIVACVHSTTLSRMTLQHGRKRSCTEFCTFQLWTSKEDLGV